MSAERPKRSRKIVNYGEDHLHWVEEAQLQKALLRSLADNSPVKKSLDENSSKSSEIESISPENIKKDKNLKKGKNANLIKTKGCSENSLKNNSCSNHSDHGTSHSFESVGSTWEDSFELRLTRLQSKLLEEAGMLDPATDKSDNPVTEANSSANDSLLLFEKKDANQNISLVNTADSDADDNLTSSRVRAQRKFAANSSPSSSRGNSPVKMHRQKIHHDATNKKSGSRKEKQSTRAVRASSTSTLSDIVEVANQDKKQTRKRHQDVSHDISKNYSSSLFKGVPKTDIFLDYLCFRNTTVKVNLHDCMKN